MKLILNEKARGIKSFLFVDEFSFEWGSLKEKLLRTILVKNYDVIKWYTV